jgi:hypothetical protein
METMLASAVKVDITPFMVTNTYLAGFAPNRLATGVAEPLTARILYLEDAAGPMVWIVADLIGYMLPDVDELRAKLTDVAPERVLFCATHTHAGPDTMGLWGPSIGDAPLRTGRDPEYLKWLIAQVVAGVRRARVRARPALFGAAEDDRDKSEWVVNIRQPGYHDQAMPVLRVDGVDGRPIACVSNFGCHPEILWEKNTEVSPDYVHHLHKTVEEATGAVSLFFNGALGGMVTGNIPDETPLEKRRPFCRKLGKNLGKIAVDAWKKAAPAPCAEIRHRTRRVTFEGANKFLLFLANLGIIERKMDRGFIETSVDVWRLGPAQFATLPGEPLPAVGFAAKRLMLGHPNFLFGLGNDELGYLIDHAAAADPKYHYELSMSAGAEATDLFLKTLADLTAEL